MSAMLKQNLNFRNFYQKSMNNIKEELDNNKILSI